MTGLPSVVAARATGFRQAAEFCDVKHTWPRGRKPKAIAAAAKRFRARFKSQGEVIAARTVDLVCAPYPVSLAFAGAAYRLNPYLGILNRMMVVRFKDFNGATRTLVWEPTIVEGSQKAPFYAQLIKFYGEFLSYKVFRTQYQTVERGLECCGLCPAEVDYLAFDHLHVQDLRMLLGTEDRPGLFPSAKLIAHRAEIDTLRAPHPMQWPWYVPDSLKGIDQRRLIEFEGDLELGIGVALMETPGHTDGNVSLCINTPDGVWVSSENGVAMDSWFPEYSRIPGVRSYAKFFNCEVVLNSNTREDSIDQYNSMLKEKALADVSRRDSRFKNILPSSELSRQKRYWPVSPTFFVGGLDYGQWP